MIGSYIFGKFVVNGKGYNSNIILKGDSVNSFPYIENHDLRLEMIRGLLDVNPEIFVIGTGASGVLKVDEKIIDYCKNKNIKLIIEKSGDAIKTYNGLLKKGKNIAAIMHNTC